MEVQARAARDSPPSGNGPSAAQDLGDALLAQAEDLGDRLLGQAGGVGGANRVVALALQLLGAEL